MKDRIPVNPGRVRITPEDGSAAFYATMTRADNPTEEGTKLNKKSLLQDSTAALFGLSDDAVPDDALSFLGKYAQHWWKRRTFETALILGEEENASVGAKPNSATSYTISYSSDITVDLENKTVSLSEPISTVSVSYNNKANADVLAGKYFVSNYDSQIYYATPGVTATSEYNYDNDQYYVYILAKSCVVDDILGNFEFIQSSNRNAYPDSGVQDGYEYQYLGVPFENAVNPVKIATGTYTGTGTYGDSNPCSLTFDFYPKLLVIIGYFSASGNYTATNAGDAYNMVSADVLSTKYIQGMGLGLYDSGAPYGKKSSDGKTIYWYHSVSEKGQFNISGYKYHYIAIG